MSFVARRLAALSTAMILLAASGSSAFAQKNYDTGASDTGIKIGNIMPYSGPLSAYGVIGTTEAAYFNKINADGGIKGRKISFISYDDGYTAQDGGTGAEARGKRRGSFHLQFARHSSEYRDSEVHEHQEGTAALCRHGCHQME